MRPHTNLERVRAALPLLLAAILIPGLLVAAYLSEQTSALDPAEVHEFSRKPASKPLRLNYVVNRTTTRSTAAISGRVTPGSEVFANDGQAWVAGERFRVRVPLRVGTNRLTVTARKPGHREVRKRVAIRRSEPRPVITPAPTTPAPGTPQSPPQQPPPMSEAPAG